MATDKSKIISIIMEEKMVAIKHLHGTVYAEPQKMLYIFIEMVNGSNKNNIDNGIAIEFIEHIWKAFNLIGLELTYDLTINSIFLKNFNDVEKISFAEFIVRIFTDIIHSHTKKSIYSLELHNKYEKLVSSIQSKESMLNSVKFMNNFYEISKYLFKDNRVDVLERKLREEVMHAETIKIMLRNTKKKLEDIRLEQMRFVENMGSIYES